MNRINRLFEKKKKNILSIFFTAGYPDLDDTLNIIREISDAQVDMIEVGIPFSDPLADGPVIQKSSQKSLDNGMNLKLMFEQLELIRYITDIPILFMGYYNVIFQYGVEKFVADCKRIGIDGVIIPDLPIEIYLQDYKEIFDKSGLKNIFLIAPQSTDERIKYIDEISDGFIYMVSSSATTGMKKDITSSQIDYFERIKALELKTPKVIGFGISDKKSFDKACEFANGAIIGSAFVNALERGEEIDEFIYHLN